MVDLDMFQDVTLWNNELSPLTEVKVRTLKSTLDNNLEIIQLDDNSAWSAGVSAELPYMVKKWLIKFLKANVGFFLVSPGEILDRGGKKPVSTVKIRQGYMVGSLMDICE